MHRSTGVLLIIAAQFGFIISVDAADWLQFRGTDNSSLVSGDSLPKSVDEKSVIWTASLQGRGLSSPVIVGDRVYITSCEGPRQEQLSVLCFSAESGDQLWKRSFWATGRTSCHPKTSVAAPSPASDGKSIVAFYSTNDVICLDLDGNLKWLRGLTHDYPNASNSLGMASSPVIADGTVICPVENDTESYTFGLDMKTGETKWKANRPRKANWTSPAVMTQGKTKLVLLQSSAGVSAVNPETGDVVWEYKDGASTIPSSVVSDEVIYIPSNGITAIRPGKSDKKTPEILWQENSLSPATASPIVVDDRVFVLNRAGVLTAADKASGERLWQLRTRGPFSGTPIVADGHMYLASEKGVLQVVDLAGKGEIVSTFDLNDVILASPSAANGAIYLRSDSSLWKIAAP